MTSSSSATSIKRGRRPKYVHTIFITGINARDLYKKYRQLKKEPAPVPSPTPDQAVAETEVKKAIVTHVLMLDFINYGCLPEITDLACCHCRHGFQTAPIGIPIRYVRKQPDPIGKQQLVGNLAPETGTNDYFLTANVACSFSCALAFVNDQKSAMYRLSKSLLYSLHYKLYGEELTVKPAPSWELLKSYGGMLSIEEFRGSFCNKVYTITPNMKRPYMVAVGRYVYESA